MTARFRFLTIVAAGLCAISSAALAQGQLKVMKTRKAAAVAAAVVPAAPLPLTPAASTPVPDRPSAPPTMKVITLDTAALKSRHLPSDSEAEVPVGGVFKVAVNKSRPLDLPRNVSEIIVGNPDIADVLVRSPTQVYLMAKAVGETNVFFLDASGKLLRRIEVSIHQDVETLRTVLAQLLPDEYIEVSAFADTITLSGTVVSDAAAQQARAIARRFVQADAQIISLLRVAGEQQVLLRVRLAEVSKNVLKELSTRLSYADQNGNINITSSLGGIPLSDPPPLGTISLSHLTFPMTLNIQALENEGLVKTLAEPTLTALSGEEARVLSGGEYPIAAFEDDDGRITVEYRDFGISLTFVPVVVGPGRISLKMASEVSSISGVGAFGFPILAVRRAVTAVEMPSGGSMMVAGVLTHDVVSSMDGVPGLMDVPVLGALFRSSSFQRQESELVVTVEAFIVEPTSPKSIALPSDGFAPASDLDRYLLGRLHKIYDKPALPVRGEVVQGPVGYIIQ